VLRAGTRGLPAALGVDIKLDHGVDKHGDGHNPWCLDRAAGADAPYAKNSAPVRVRPSAGRRGADDRCTVGYSKSNTSPILKLFLSRTRRTGGPEPEALTRGSARCPSSARQGASSIRNAIGAFRRVVILDHRFNERAKDDPAPRPGPDGTGAGRMAASRSPRGTRSRQSLDAVPSASADRERRQSFVASSGTGSAQSGIPSPSPSLGAAGSKGHGSSQSLTPSRSESCRHGSMQASVPSSGQGSAQSGNRRRHGPNSPGRTAEIRGSRFSCRHHPSRSCTGRAEAPQTTSRDGPDQSASGNRTGLLDRWAMLSALRGMHTAQS